MNEVTEFEVAKDDKRFYEVTSKSFEEAKQRAFEHFQINDESLLEHTILAKGGKKFIFFGPQEVTYRFNIKAIFKKLLLPFLIKVIKLAKLNIFVEVSYREPNVKISFSGKDEKLMSKDNHALLYSFDHLIRLYLYRKVVLPKGTRISVNLVNGPERQERSNNTNNEEINQDDLRTLINEIETRLHDGVNEYITNTLSPATRRLIHQHFQDSQRYETQSIGNGRFKKVSIKIK